MELITEAASFYGVMNLKIKELDDGRGKRVMLSDLFNAIMVSKKIEVMMADMMCEGRGLTYSDLTECLHKDSALLRKESMFFIESKGTFERLKAGLVLKLDRVNTKPFMPLPGSDPPVIIKMSDRDLTFDELANEGDMIRLIDLAGLKKFKKDGGRDGD